MELGCCNGIELWLNFAASRGVRDEKTSGHASGRCSDLQIRSLLLARPNPVQKSRDKEGQLGSCASTNDQILEQLRQSEQICIREWSCKCPYGLQSKQRTRYVNFHPEWAGILIAAPVKRKPCKYKPSGELLRQFYPTFLTAGYLQGIDCHSLFFFCMLRTPSAPTNLGFSRGSSSLRAIPALLLWANPAVICFVRNMLPLERFGHWVLVSPMSLLGGGFLSAFCCHARSSSQPKRVCPSIGGRILAVKTFPSLVIRAACGQQKAWWRCQLWLTAFGCDLWLCSEASAKKLASEMSGSDQKWLRW